MSALSTHHEPLRFLRAPHRAPWRPVRPPQRRPRRRLGARESADVRLIASRHYLIEAAPGRRTRLGNFSIWGSSRSPLTLERSQGERLDPPPWLRGPHVSGMWHEPTRTKRQAVRAVRVRSTPRRRRVVALPRVSSGPTIE